MPVSDESSQHFHPERPAATFGAGGIGPAGGPAAAAAVSPSPRIPISRIAAVALFFLVAIGGTYLVKWLPYYVKGHAVAAHHQLGKSIISDGGAVSPDGWQAAIQYAIHYGLSVWQAFLLGLLIAAGIQELVPRDWLLRLFGSLRMRSVGLGGLAAVPSMMCTCCAAPPAVALARSRASTGAVLAYWLGNPVLNPATIVFMGLVLGWRWALLRIVVGVMLVLGAATLAQRFFEPKNVPGAALDSVAAAARPAGARPLPLRYLAALARLAAFLVPEYAVIVLALGAARAFLFPAMSPAVGHAVWLVILLAITGTLFVIPTAGEIPVIQTFLRFGLGAAGAGALLITLPAVSLPSLVMVGQAIPKRTLVFVGGAVTAAGLLASGLAVVLGL